MSNQTHSQDSVSDPRNEDDYDTWEYGTEPLPDDHTWGTKKVSTFDHLAFGDYDGYEETYKEAAEADSYYLEIIMLMKHTGIFPIKREGS